MFAIADMVTIEALTAGIENLRENPHHLEYIMKGYHQSSFLRKIHGSNYIRQFKEWIRTNSIKIQPYYVLDTNILPSVTVTATYDESDQFLGDYGETRQEILEDGECVADFDATSISEDKMELVVSGAYKLQEHLLPGMYLKNGDYSGKIEYILVNDDTATVRVTSPVPQILGGWRAEKIAPKRKVVVNASLNQTTVFIKVKSHGDVELHKLLCMVIRYCLKYGRHHLDRHGLQVATFRQEMMVLEDPEQSIYASSFMITGKTGDFWIVSEEIVPTAYGMSITAVREGDDYPSDSNVIVDML